MAGKTKSNLMPSMQSNGKISTLKCRLAFNGWMRSEEPAI